MRRDGLRQVEVGQPVAVGEQEALAADDIACPLQASAGHGVVAGVEHRDLPLLDAAAHAGHLPGRQIDPEVAVQACVVEEVELDDLRLVAGEHDELRSEEHTSELQSLMRISYAVFCLKKKQNN